MTQRTDHARVTSRDPNALSLTATRPLTDRDQDILVKLLTSVDVEGVSELLEQVSRAGLRSESTATYRALAPDPAAPVSSIARGDEGKLPGLFAVDMPSGRPVGEFVLWVRDGRLHALEYLWYTQREPLTLPPAEWLTIEDELADPERSWRRLALATLAGLAALTLIAAAFALGRAGGADVDGARQAGERAGIERGTQIGERAGAEQGAREGLLDGREETFQPAYETAFAEARASAYRTAVTRARARAARDKASAGAAASAAAAATPSYAQDNTTCSGYRDARGYWVCSP